MRYVIAVDGNEASRHATAYIRSFIRPCDTVVAFCASKQNTPVAAVVSSALQLFTHLPEAQRTAVVEPGDVCDGILRATTADDVIVCGSRGHNQLKRSILGSVSTEIAAALTVGSILVVHTPALDYGQSYLLCIDGSAYSRQAISLLARILQPEDVVVVWYGFIPPPLLTYHGDQLARNANYGHVWEGMEKRGNYFVEEAVQALIDSKTIPPQNIFSKVDACADPKSDVIAFADINNIKTLVVGARFIQVGATRRPALSSFVSHIIHNATRHAVLVVKSPEEADDAERTVLASPEKGGHRHAADPFAPNPHEGQA